MGGFNEWKDQANAKIWGISKEKAASERQHKEHMRKLDSLGREQTKQLGQFQREIASGIDSASVIRERIEREEAQARSLERQAKARQERIDHRDCPRCFERIKRQARVCRFCDAELADAAFHITARKLELSWYANRAEVLEQLVSVGVPAAWRLLLADVSEYYKPDEIFSAFQTEKPAAEWRSGCRNFIAEEFCAGGDSETLRNPPPELKASIDVARTIAEFQSLETKYLPQITVLDVDNFWSFLKKMDENHDGHREFEARGLFLMATFLPFPGPLLFSGNLDSPVEQTEKSAPWSFLETISPTDRERSPEVSAENFLTQVRKRYEISHPLRLLERHWKSGLTHVFAEYFQEVTQKTESGVQPRDSSKTLVYVSLALLALLGACFWMAILL